MNKVSVQLNQDYKQFKCGFKTDLLGPLIIISGINGTGKTQLLDIISQLQVINVNISKLDLQKYVIDATIKIDNNIINRVFVSRRSFKDNIKMNDIALPNPKNIYWHKDEAWNFFSNYHSWDNDTLAFSKSKSVVLNCLKEKGLEGFPKFNASKKNNTDTGITESDFKDALPDNFVWEQDDLFANSVDKLFYEFAAKRHDEQAKLGRENGGFNHEKYLKNAPWTILNELFKKLNFSYRFKDDYEFVTPNLKERPMLYSVLSDGTLDLKNPREVSELSDGEKAIISLTFALMNEARRPLEKLLLLDEFDNTLNPSLIESLFTIIEEYFISKGVIVIMTTHSPVTISLAPDYARYYEIFRQDRNSPKIIPVDKFQYTELRIANKDFYQKLEDQSARIKELENENKIKLADKILFVEDKYVNIYKLGWLKLHDINPTIDNLEEEFSKYASFEIYSKGNKDSLKGFLSNPFMDEWDGKRIVGLFDFDDAYNCFKSMLKYSESQSKWEKVSGSEASGLYSRRCKYTNVSMLMLPVPDYRNDIANKNQSINRLEVELLFKNEDIEEIYGHNNFSKERVIGNVEIPKIKNKEDFWKKVIILSKDKFAGFIPLFQAVNLLLDINEDKNNDED